MGALAAALSCSNTAQGRTPINFNYCCLMTNRVFWLKPCRATDAMPTLEADTVMRNASNGIETCVVLDLNILNRFSAHQTSPTSDHPAALAADIAAIKDILNIPHMFVAPGFALGEADEGYLEGLFQSYESFFSTELSTYLDAPNALEPRYDRQRSRKYKSLPAEDQQFLSFAYLSLLKVHDILVFQSDESPEAKFDLYLEFMDGVADIVPGIEIEVAKHCFFRGPQNATDSFLVQSRAILDNFDKGGRGDKRVDRILNGARDIMYLRSAATQDGRPLDGSLQDTWLLTCDSGVAALCASIYFYPAEGERSKFTTTANSVFRRTNSYWKYVDKTSRDLLGQRAVAHRRRGALVSDALLQRVTGLARELNNRLADETQNKLL